MGVAVTRLAIGLWHVRQLRRSCTAVAAADLDPIVRKTVEALQSSGSLGSKTVTIATSEEVRVPAAIGFRKKTIVLPAWALRELPPEDLNVILLHEFAHLRRGDDWTNLIQKIVRAIFFFHPAVWWIESRLSMEREMACDDAVLAETSNPRGYASCLVSLLEKNMAHRSSAKASGAKTLDNGSGRCRPSARSFPAVGTNSRCRSARGDSSMEACIGSGWRFFHVLSFCASARAAGHSVRSRPEYGGRFQVCVYGCDQPGRVPFSASPSGAPGVLAGMNTSTELAPGLQDIRRSSVRPRALPAHQPVPVRAVAARWNGNWHGSRTGSMSSAPAQVTLAGAKNGRNPVPQFETLVFIEATQYPGYGSPVWSVQVWQVTFVSSVNGRPTSMATANSI